MSTKGAKDIQFFVSEKAGVVSGLLVTPSEARVLLVLAHGAGAGMRLVRLADGGGGEARGGARAAVSRGRRADVILPGIARCVGGFEIVEAALPGAGKERRIVRRRRRRSFVPYAEERAQVG